MLIGIDLGSRAIKLVALADGAWRQSEAQESGFDPRRQALAMLEKYPASRVVATGYGRHLAQRHFASEAITEIKAHALGARHLFPECSTILDVGGQDCKVIRLDRAGRVVNFQMNDKCAAGTGRFLEIMAAILGYDLEEFGAAALSSRHETAINSMCAVFAESEVISMKNAGLPPADIARAVHLSVANRLAAMLNRAAPAGGPLVFSGGVAKNPCLVALLTQQTGSQVLVPPAPAMVGALGAALHALGGA